MKWVIGAFLIEVLSGHFYLFRMKKPRLLKVWVCDNLLKGFYSVG
jgi:hypothetical protein